MNVVGRVVADVTDAAPRALTPGWAHGTWAGRAGHAGLAATVRRHSSTLQVTDKGLAGSAEALGLVAGGRDWDGVAHDRLGWFQRKVHLGVHGELRVDHANLSLPPWRHGTGFASEWVGRSFERYAAAGVDRVEVRAARTHGGWAWARAGFVPDPRKYGGAGADEVVDALVGAAHVARRTTDEQHTAVRAAAPRTMAELAALPDGRAVLAGSQWWGVRELHPSSPWWSPRAGADAAAAAVQAALPPGIDHALVHASVLDVLRGADVVVDDWRDATSQSRVVLSATPAVGTRLELPVVDAAGGHGWVAVRRDLRPDGRTEVTVDVATGMKRPRRPRPGSDVERQTKDLARSIRDRLSRDLGDHVGGGA